MASVNVHHYNQQKSCQKLARLINNFNISRCLKMFRTFGLFPRSFDMASTVSTPNRFHNFVFSFDKNEESRYTSAVQKGYDNLCLILMFTYVIISGDRGILD